MKEHQSSALICVNDEQGLTYALCGITYFEFEDGSFRYVFRPNYSVMELLPNSVFEGIPGLDLDLKKEEYVRENVVPAFIAERVPSSRREDYLDLLSSISMETMEPLEYLLKTSLRYFGDELYLKPFAKKRLVEFHSLTHPGTTASFLHQINQELALGNDVSIDGEKIDDANRRSCFHLFRSLEAKASRYRQKLLEEGVAKAKRQGKYQGRKPIPLDRMSFLKALAEVEEGKLSPKEAAKRLGISIDKYYREKKKIGNG